MNDVYINIYKSYSGNPWFCNIPRRQASVRDWATYAWDWWGTEKSTLQAVECLYNQQIPTNSKAIEHSCCTRNSGSYRYTCSPSMWRFFTAYIASLDTYTVFWHLVVHGAWISGKWSSSIFQSVILYLTYCRWKKSCTKLLGSLSHYSQVLNIPSG